MRSNAARRICLALGTLLLSALVQDARAAELKFKVQTSAGMVVADAVVYLTPTSGQARANPPKVTIDQVNRQFVPRVSVFPVGTPVSFPNSDNIRHSVYSFSAAKTFTLKLYAGTPATPVVFDKPGVVVLGCDIHDRMVAWALVLDTPYYARTDATGAVTLANVPPGDYQLRAWHEPMSSEQPGQSFRVAGEDASVHTLQLDPGADVAGMQH